MPISCLDTGRIQTSVGPEEGFALCLGFGFMCCGTFGEN